MQTAGFLNRRKFLTSSLALASTFELQRAARALGFAPDAEVCRLMAEQEVGPYYVPSEMVRSNINEGKPGLPFTSHIAILETRTVNPSKMWPSTSGTATLPASNPAIRSRA